MPAHKKLRSPIVWFGGKGMMIAKLLPLFPEHKIYVEAFGGGASLLFAKEPSPIEVYNDVDSGLVNFFRVLRDEEQFKRLHMLVSLTPYSREEYYYCRDTWHTCTDAIERAYRWYVVARWSFSGSFGGSWSSTTTTSRVGMAKPVATWLSIVDALPEISSRLKMVQVEHETWERILERYDNADTLFYLDPPYVPDTRRDGKYTHELTGLQHHSLVTTLLKLQGKVMLSGYASPVYKPLEEAGWQRVDFTVSCYATARTKPSGILGKGSASTATHQRVESVWLNYEPPNSLEEAA